jgi:hypothetical protein
MEELHDCPICGTEHSVFEVKMGGVNTRICQSCGYQTNDLMLEGEFQFEEYEAELPQLYVDAKKVDETKKVWYPNVVNIPDKGTVFLNGTNVEESQWSAILNVKLKAADKKKPMFKGKTHKSDSSTMKSFGKDYLSALEYIGIDL